MAQVYSLIDANGETRLSVQIVPAPGGSPPVTRELFLSADQSVASGVLTDLEWTKSSGDDLVDLTDPAFPVIISAGVYGFSVTAYCSDGLQAGKYARVEFAPDVLGSGPDLRQNFPLTGPAGGNPFGSLSVDWYCGAGATLEASLAHDCGAPKNFKLLASIQSIS